MDADEIAQRLLCNLASVNFEICPLFQEDLKVRLVLHCVSMVSFPAMGSGCVHIACCMAFLPRHCSICSRQLKDPLACSILLAAKPEILMSNFPTIINMTRRMGAPHTCILVFQDYCCRGPTMTNCLSAGRANLAEPGLILPCCDQAALACCQQHGISAAEAYLLERQGDIPAALAIFISEINKANAQLHAAVKSGRTTLPRTAPRCDQPAMAISQIWRMRLLLAHHGRGSVTWESAI